MNYGGNFLKKNIFTVIDLILDFICQLFLGLLHLRYIRCIGYEIVTSSMTLKYFKCSILFGPRPSNALNIHMFYFTAFKCVKHNAFWYSAQVV